MMFQTIIIAKSNIIAISFFEKKQNKNSSMK
jgi:hypothetical protein